MVMFKKLILFSISSSTVNLMVGVRLLNIVSTSCILVVLLL